MTQAGPAQPVVHVTTGLIAATPALRVAVVTDGRAVLGGPTMAVYAVNDNRPTQGNEPIPIVVATGAQANTITAGPAIPVIVVSGVLP